MKRSPVTWVPTAYFAMGLPFVVVNMVSVLMLQGMGADAAAITFWTSLILLPWSLKPLWSPLMELFGTKKAYVVGTQMLTGIAFGLTALSLNFHDFFIPAVAALALAALSGATHDVACDGVYMSELSSEDQARYIGWQGAFYNIAKIAASGGLVYLAGVLIKKALPEGAGPETASLAESIAANRYSWTIIMAILGAVMAALAIYHIFFLPGNNRRGDVSSSPTVGAASAHPMRELWNVLAEFFRKPYIWLYILFIVLYRFGEGFVVKIVPLFLKASRETGGLGLDNEQIGICYGTFGAAAFVIGSLLAGYYISARGLHRTLLSLVAVFNVPFLVYVFLAWWQPENIWIIGTGIVLEYFGYGFGFVGLTLFMMQQVAPGKHQMAHYAFASGIMNLGVMIPGMMSGALCDAMGYTAFFIMVMIATVPAFLMAWKLPFRYDDKGNLLEDAENAALTDSEGTIV